MELLQILWVGVFFFLLLIILFVWSKITIIETKKKRLDNLLGDMNKIYEDVE